MGILALSRAGDAFSIDAWLRRRKGEPPPGPSGEYTWPIRFVWVSMGVLYFCAGYSKLAFTGLDYYDPEIMRANLLRVQFFAHQIRFTDWAEGIAQVPWMCSAMSVGALLLELTFPLALISVWARRMIVPAMFLGHIGIAVVLGPRFFQFLAVYVFWVPWDRLVGLGADSPAVERGQPWPEAQQPDL